jgi:hypothetical protein
MDNEKSLVFEEYKISKESISSIMNQLSTVTASLLALSIAILQFSTDKVANNVEIVLWYMVLLLINFLAVYVVYQNVQITALQKHIAYLEKKLGSNDVFRWESVVARIWYEGKDFRSRLLNVLLIIPPLALLVLVYIGIAIKLGIQNPVFCISCIVNLFYLGALILGFERVRSEINKISLALTNEMKDSKLN